MPELSLQRIPFPYDADNRLRMMKARTGITANILCRIGFCLSLEEPGIPEPLPKGGKLGREINRYTLMGEYDVAYVALLITSMKASGIRLKQLDAMFVAHMNRGVELLTARVKSIADICTLVA